MTTNPSELDLERAKRFIIEACVNTCEHTYIRPENVYECIAEALASERASLPESVELALGKCENYEKRDPFYKEEWGTLAETARADLRRWQKNGPEPRKDGSNAE